MQFGSFGPELLVFAYKFGLVMTLSNLEAPNKVIILDLNAIHKFNSNDTFKSIRFQEVISDEMSDY